MLLPWPPGGKDFPAAEEWRRGCNASATGSAARAIAGRRVVPPLGEAQPSRLPPRTSDESLKSLRDENERTFSRPGLSPKGGTPRRPGGLVLDESVLPRRESQDGPGQGPHPLV
jgi:hypothetical protein